MTIPEAKLPTSEPQGPGETDPAKLPQEPYPSDPSYSIPGWNVLLQGESGVGKTTSLRTLVTECGLELFVLFCENSMEILADLPSDKVHWHYCPPAAGSISDLLDSARIINDNSYEQLCKMKQGINKKKYAQWVDFVTALSSFTDDRTGENFGDVDTWGPERVLVLDGLKGMATMSRDLMIGAKPVCTQGEYGVAMDNLERFVQHLTMSTRCQFVLISHVDMLVDEIQGGMKIHPQALGKKLGPKLPSLFSEVILAERMKTTFTWSTAATNAIVKGRSLPIQDGLEPSFKLLHQLWSKKTSQE